MNNTFQAAYIYAALKQVQKIQNDLEIYTHLYTTNWFILELKTKKHQLIVNYWFVGLNFVLSGL